MNLVMLPLVVAHLWQMRKVKKEKRNSKKLLSYLVLSPYDSTVALITSSLFELMLLLLQPLIRFILICDDFIHPNRYERFPAVYLYKNTDDFFRKIRQQIFSLCFCSRYFSPLLSVSHATILSLARLLQATFANDNDERIRKN